MNKLKSLKVVWNKYQYILTTSQKRLGIVIIIMTLLGAFCEMLGVSVIIPLVQVMIEPQQLRNNRYFSFIFDAIGVSTDIGLIWVIGIVVILVYLLKNVFLVVVSYARVKYACKIQRELSIEMLDSYMKRGYIFFVNTGTGELLRGMQKSIANTYTGLYQMFKLFSEVVTIFFICVYIMISDFVMAVCIATLAIICFVIVVFVCQKWVKKCGEIYYKYSALVNKTLLQTFHGIKEILVMQRQRYFIDSYKNEYQEEQKGYIGQNVAMESPAYMIEAICVAGLIVAVCVKAISIDSGVDLIPQLASFAVAAFRILPSLGRISSNFNQFMFCIPGINDTYNNFKEVRNFKEKNYSQTLLSSTKHEFTKEISIEHISWKYPTSEHRVLKDVSIVIKKGQAVAFVGKSGGGKTTLSDILLGLLNPQKGYVKIDGVDITNISNKSKLMGFVPQNVNLLDDTVRRNVAFGIMDKEIDDDKVWKALEQAQLKEIIEKTPDGLDTEIGERGIRFSGGQRQRLAIARALYDNPDILILDEATSALDTETETAVMEAINSLQGYKTLIIIAHRLTTIRNCDVIYEIGDGKAVKRNYEELI